MLAIGCACKWRLRCLVSGQMSDSDAVKLRSGELRFSSGVNLTVELERNGAVSRVVLPMPRKGYGGHELVVAPDEQHAALYLFSGQSEQGWELFALTPTLQHRVGLPMTFGEGSAPVFSSDGHWLVMWVATGAFLADGDGANDLHFDDVHDAESDARCVLEWSRLYVQRLADEAVASTPILCDVPRRLDPDTVADWNTYDALRFVDALTLELTMPWGAKVQVALSLAEPSAPIIATYPNVE